MKKQIISESDQQWLDHCAEMKRLCDAKVAEMKSEGWKNIGTSRFPRLLKNGEKVELRRQLGSKVWYTVSI